MDVSDAQPRELEGGLYTEADKKARAAEGLDPWIITTDWGNRVWWAEDEGHAEDQHVDAFPDEPIFAVELGP